MTELDIQRDLANAIASKNKKAAQTAQLALAVRFGITLDDDLKQTINNMK